MSKKKKVMSLRKAEFFELIVSGIALICYGVIKLSIFEEIVTGILALICLVAIIIPYGMFFFKKDKEDEASKIHHLRAGAWSGAIIIFCFMVMFVLNIFKLMNDVKLETIVPFVIGIYSLLTGILFIYFEKVGD